MIKVIVLDDEWYNLEEISDLVEKTGFMQVVGKYQNPLKALQEVCEISPDVAFIDIEMPEMNGLNLAEKLLEIDPSIIIAFISSWNQYAIHAFDLNVIDYIMKPIKEDRFLRMIDKIRMKYNDRTQIYPKEINIRCFDTLEMYIGDMPVKWERAKAEELFAYLLIHHGQFVHKDKIIEDLWSGYEYSKALPILQTSICKIRNLLSDVKDIVKVEYSGSKYCLYLKEIKCDLLQFEKALSDYKRGIIATYGAVVKAFSIYHKGLLTQQGYLWSIQKNETLRNRLILIIKEIIQNYTMEENETEMIRYMNILAKLTPYDEEINYNLLNLLWHQGRYDSIEKHYQWLKHVLSEDYDTVPSDLIRSIAKNGRVL